MSKKETLINYGQKNTEQKRTRSAKKNIEKNEAIKSFEISNQQKNIEQNEQIIAPRRGLRKMIQIQQENQQKTQKLISPEPSEDNKSQEQYHDQKNNHFCMQNSSDLQKQKKPKSSNKKKSKQLQNNTHLEDYIEKMSDKKPYKAAQKEKRKHEVQTLLTQSFVNNALKNKRKNSDQDFITEKSNQKKQESSSLSKVVFQKLKIAKNAINGDLTDEEAFMIAQRLSLQQEKPHNNLDEYEFNSKQNSQGQQNNQKQLKEIKHQPQIEGQFKIQKNKIPKQNKNQINNVSKSYMNKSLENIHKSENKAKSVEKTKKVNDKKNSVNVGPFSSHTIFMTGQFEPYSKNQLSQILRKLGAQCPTSTNLPKKGKVTQLFAGLYCVDNYGRKIAKDVTTNNKYLQAVQRKVPIIHNNQIENFFQRVTGKTISEYIQEEQREANKEKVQFMKKIDKSSNNNLSERMNQNGYQIFIPWTQKYKPSELSNVIGQQSQIKQLAEWLQAWDDIHIRGNKRQTNKKGSSGDINSKAALISGDPGLGKTTTARLLAQSFNYMISQFNASDVRNKSNVKQLESNSYTLQMGTFLQKGLIIMDEIDGMSGGDRGGSAAIIEMIKKSKVPIICICNDRQSVKIKSIANYCLDIKFHKPDKRIITKRLMEIIGKENATAQERAIQRVVQIFQNDIRKILTYLEILVRTVTKRITLNIINGNTAQSKDSTVMVNHFQALRRLMNLNGMSLRQKLDTFFIDSDIMPIMTHQNYLNSITNKKNENQQTFHRLVQANQSFVMGDILDKKIRKQQQWGLMPSFGVLCCLYPIYKVSNALGFPQFPAFLGKFSSQRKNKRLLRELKYAIGPTITGTQTAVQSNYSPMLFKTIYTHFKHGNIQEVLDFMEAYGINPTIFNENLTSLQFNPKKLNLLAEIPTQLKTKLTKAYNKRYEATKIKTVKPKIKTEHQKFDPVLEQVEKDQQEEEQQEEEEEVVMIDMKKSKKK